jgi:hypothetical protein
MSSSLYCLGSIYTIELWSSLSLLLHAVLRVSEDVVDMFEAVVTCLIINLLAEWLAAHGSSGRSDPPTDCNGLQ